MNEVGRGTSNALAILRSYCTWRALRPRLRGLPDRGSVTEVWDTSKQHGVSLRQGAYFLAIQRVAEATTDRGIYP